MLGRGTVLEEFLINHKSKKQVPVAGCRVNQGVFDRQKLFRLERGGGGGSDGGGGIVRVDGCLVESLKHFKDEATTVGVGKECGLKLVDHEVRFQAGDTLVCYELKPEIPDLEWDTGF